MGFTSRNPTKPRKKTISCLWRGRGREHTEQPTVFSKNLKRPPDSTSPGEGQARSSPSSLPVSPTGKRNPCQGPGPGTQDANPRKFHPEGVEGAPPHAGPQGCSPTTAATSEQRKVPAGVLTAHAPQPHTPHTCEGKQEPRGTPFGENRGERRVKAAGCQQACHSALSHPLLQTLPLPPCTSTSKEMG